MNTENTLSNKGNVASADEQNSGFSANSSLVLDTRWPDTVSYFGGFLESFIKGRVNRDEFGPTLRDKETNLAVWDHGERDSTHRKGWLSDSGDRRGREGPS